MRFSDDVASVMPAPSWDYADLARANHTTAAPLDAAHFRYHIGPLRFICKVVYWRIHVNLLTPADNSVRFRTFTAKHERLAIPLASKRREGSCLTPISDPES